MELRDLHKMTVVKIREVALQQGDIVGVHGMSRQEIIEALAPRLGIDLEAATKAARTRFAGNKTTMKQEIRSLKAQRDAALADHDAVALSQARKSLKQYKRVLRRTPS